MLLIFIPFALVLIYFSLRSFIGGVAYLNYFKHELARPRSDFRPFVTIIAPCKGMDEGLASNLAALVAQDYGDYEIVFVVDDESDPAVDCISTIVRDVKNRAKLVVAPKAENSGQKVENLREAVLHADPRSDVFAFVDSDVRPGRDWLRQLVAHLADDTAGATTGYRWYVSQEPTFATELRAAWNASIASSLGPNLNSNFCWGGSTAVLRTTFDKIGMRDRWSGTLSDDFAMTAALNDAGLSIRFVPQALVPSVGTCSLHEMLEFTTRQMKVTRVYAPHLWKMSFFGSGLFNLVLIVSIIFIVLSETDTPAFWAGLGTLVLVSVLSVGKAVFRWRAVRLVLPEYGKELDRQFFPQVTLWALTPAIFLYNCIAALSRTMVWRGLAYELASPTETRVISDE